MKIPDNSEIYKNGYEEKNGNSIEFNGARKKQSSSHFLLKFIVLALLAAALVFVWINAATIFEPLRGIASKIENKTSYDIGFPVELPGSSGYSFERFGDCFSLLTDTYLYTYETTGEQIYALKHGYSNPHQATNDKRILLFDMAAYSFSVYNKTSVIYQKTLEDKIVYAAVGDANYSAVVTESPRYSNILYIYDDGGNWKYTKKFADENVMQVGFTGDGEHIIVSTVSVQNGELITNLYKFSIKTTEDHIWKYSFRGNSLPCGLYAGAEKIILVCDNIVVSVDTATGERNDSYYYTGQLKCFDANAESVALNYNDASTNKNILIILNSDAQAVTLTNVGSHTAGVTVDNYGVYILDGIHLRILSRDYLTETDSITLNDDFYDFIKIGNSFYMLSYDCIDRIDR